MARSGQRPFNGTDGDDTFSLVVNGQSWSLVRIPDTDGDPNTIDYRTSEESYWRVRRYHQHGSYSGYPGDVSYWVAWDKEGTAYYFETRAWYPIYRGGCSAPFIQTWKWGLSRVRNRFGQEMTYTYASEVSPKDHADCAGYSAYAVTAMYPQAIRYGGGKYRVQFVRTQDRTDWSTQWESRLSYTLFERSRLREIQVWYDPSGAAGENSRLIRKYALGYTDGVILPAVKWRTSTTSEGQWPALTSITEYGLDGAAALPPTTFTYGDSMHLTEARNGYGGTVTFTYESQPWYELSSDADPMVNEGGGVPFFGYDPNGSCRLGPPPDYVDTKMGDPVSVYHPGKMYRISVSAHWPCSGPYSLDRVITFGIYTSTSSRLFAEENKNVDYENDMTGVVTAYVRVPTNASRVQFFIKPSVNFQFRYYKAWPVTTRYRVLAKTFTDEITGQSYTYTYRYDEPATNDEIHSQKVETVTEAKQRYTPAFSEYRGHAMVEEIAPDGTTTTTFYHQQDATSGKTAAALSGRWSAADDFAALDAALWQAQGASTTRLRGDPALKLAAGGDLTRTAYTLTTGEVLLAQFFLDEGAQGHFWLESESGRQWGIFAHDNAVDLFYDSGDGLRTQPLAGGLTSGQWYIVLLGVGDEQMFARVWPREDVGQGGLAQLPTPPAMQGQAWRFHAQAGSGNVFLDTYREGRLLSLSETRYAADTLYDRIANNGIPDLTRICTEKGKDYLDFSVVWTRPVEQTTYAFYGGAEWTATRTFTFYELTWQGGKQYSNPTAVVESYWDGQTFRDYRLTRTAYYPNTNGANLTGLPGIVNRYRCPEGTTNGSCAAVLGQMLDSALRGAEEYLLGSQWYLYDNAFYDDPARNYTSPPQQGILTGERTLLTLSPTARYRETRYAYDAWGNRAEVTAYPAAGTLETPNLADGQTTRTEYDPIVHAYPVRTINALGHTTTLTYDYALGVPLSETDPNGATTRGEYDAFGRLLKIIRPGDTPSSPTIQIAYYDTARPFYTEVQQKIDGATPNFVLRKYYNGLGQRLQTQILGVNGNDILSDVYYDPAGRVRRETIPYEVPAGNGYNAAAHASHDAPAFGATTEYDDLGRAWRVTAPDGSATTTSWGVVYRDGIPHVQTCTRDALGHATCSHADAFGRTTFLDAPEGPDVTYTYDAANNLLAASRGGATVAMAYDLAGRKVRMDDPDMGHWEYAYDALGNLIQQTDARGCTTQLAYDTLNRLTRKEYLNCPTTASVSYTYDESANGIGRKTSMQDASGVTRYFYDARGRLIKQEWALNYNLGYYAVRYAYNSADLPVSVVYPDNEVVATTYNRLLQPIALRSNQPGGDYVTQAVYDAQARLQRLTLGKNQSLEYAYYPLVEQGGRLRNLRFGDLLDLTYAYDALGNITRIEDRSQGILDPKTNSPQIQTFAYDSLNRLVQAQASGGAIPGYAQSYAYDPQSGNLLRKGDLTLAYADPAHVHAATQAGPNAYAYDANGNMVSRIENGITYTQEWDAENRLARVRWTQDGVQRLAIYLYDGEGQRVVEIEKAGSEETATVYIGGLYEEKKVGTNLSALLGAAPSPSGGRTLAAPTDPPAAPPTAEQPPSPPPAPEPNGSGTVFGPYSYSVTLHVWCEMDARAAVSDPGMHMRMVLTLSNGQKAYCASGRGTTAYRDHIAVTLPIGVSATVSYERKTPSMTQWQPYAGSSHTAEREVGVRLYNLSGARYVTWAEQESTAFEQAQSGNLNLQRQQFAEDVIPDTDQGMTFFVILAVGNDTTPPTLPTAVNETHGIQNDQWQRAVNDPAFAWSPAEDNPGGDGVAGYYVYWGQDPNGASAYYQTTTTYDPPAVESGIYYLRLQTQDRAGNRSPWQTLFVFRYDNTPPVNPPAASARLRQNVSRRPGPPQPSTTTFTWSGASDAHSGVAGYYVYWGPNPNGTSTRFTTTPSFTAPSAFGRGVYYLRLRTQDAVGNLSNWETVYRYTTNPVTKYYYFHNQCVAIRQGADVSFFLADHLGSVSLVTDRAGNPVSAQRYLPFGETRYTYGISPTDHAYTGQKREAALGLYFYNARYYSPTLGRFISADSIVPPGAQGLDRYAYANNNPLRYNDPTGHYPASACDSVPENVKQSCLDGADKPLPDNLDWNKLTSRGKKLYRKYLNMYANTNGWWWEAFGDDGQFSIWEFMGIIWGYELNIVATQDDIYSDAFEPYVEALVRSSREYCKVMNCDPSSAEGLLNFTGAYSQSAQGRAYADNPLFDMQDPRQLTAGMDLTLSIQDPSYMNHPEWGSGFDPNRPYSVGNGSMLPSYLNMVNSRGYFWYRTPGWEKNPLTAMYILTGCQTLFIQGNTTMFKYWNCQAPY